MNPEITKIIDQYLNGELSPSDHKAFEERLATNEKLREEVELQKNVIEGAKRAAQRGKIEKIKKQYHLNQFLKWGGIVLVGVIAISAVLYLTVFNSTNLTQEEVSEELKEQLEEFSNFDNIEAQYFQIPEEGSVVMSTEGVLLSIPENAFLLNGSAYSGSSVIQFQEAIQGEDIVLAGLSTMSGDRLLETQGMFGLRAFTPDGTELEIDPKVGIYAQVPVDENKEGMQLFEGKPDQNGNVDWQNPQPLAKIPVPVDMSELDFYPEQYEPYLDEQKWKKSKKSRDSLYLSLERFDYKYRIENYFEQEPDTTFYFYADSIGGYNDAVVAGDEAAPNFILPSKVLGFWNKKFNNTILATREFEQRMREIHCTCDNSILNQYINNLDLPLSEIDRKVVAMGYPNFEKFAAQNVGKLDVSNPHLKNLKSFYEQAVKQLKSSAKKNQLAEQKRQEKWDGEMNEARQHENDRTTKRNTEALNEEYAFNMKQVRRQIGPTVGVTIRYGRGTVYNIDKYVWDATVNRTSMDRIDPVSGKRVKITYNKLNFSVQNSDKYIKLYAYVFPNKLNSYQRIDGKNGKFSYPLNDDLIYDIGVVGVTENGYEYFQKSTFKEGELGEISLEVVSESKLKASIKQLNNKRISKPMRIDEELNWLVKEREDFVEQKMRQEMRQFRYLLAIQIFPCRFLN